MSPTILKGLGAALLVLCAVLLFVGWERYQSNANNVRAMQQMGGGMMGAMVGGNIEPATPAATKYALVFAGVSAIGGGACFVLSSRQRPGG